MLFLLAARTSSAFVELPASFASSAAGENFIALCSPAQDGIDVRSVSGIEDVSPETVRVKLAPVRDVRVSRALLETLFASAKTFLFPDDMPEKLAALGANLDSAPVVLDLTERDGALSVTFVDAARSVFVPHRLSQADTAQFYRALDALKAETDRGIDSGKFDAAAAAAKFSRLLASFAAPVPERLGGLSGRRLEIRLDGVKCVPPFELLDAPVKYLAAGTSSRKPGANGGRALVIHSPELIHSAAELTSLRSALGSRFKLEIRPDTAADAGTEGGYGIVHFSGHGETSDGKGFVRIDGIPSEILPGAGTPGHLTLNCCHAGWCLDGVVRRSIESGVSSVIASPYRLPDQPGRGISEFYRFYRPESAFAAFCLACLVEPGAKTLYRFYSHGE